MDFYYLEEINCFAKIFERTNFFRNNYFTDMKFNIFQNQISFLYLYFTTYYRVKLSWRKFEWNEREKTFEKMWRINLTNLKVDK